MEEDNNTTSTDTPETKTLGSPGKTDLGITPEEESEAKAHSETIEEPKPTTLTGAEAAVNDVKEKMTPIEPSVSNAKEIKAEPPKAKKPRKRPSKPAPTPEPKIDFEAWFLALWKWFKGSCLSFIGWFGLMICIAFTVTFGIVTCGEHKENARLSAENQRIQTIEIKYRTLRHWAEHDRSWRKRFLMVDQMYSDTLYYRDDIRDLQNHISRLDSVAASKK